MIAICLAHIIYLIPKKTKAELSFNVEEMLIPSVPLKVKIEDLTPNGRLLNETQTEQVILFVKNYLQKQFSSSQHQYFNKDKKLLTHRFKKIELGIPYDVIVDAKNKDDVD